MRLVYGVSLSLWMTLPSLSFAEEAASDVTIIPASPSKTEPAVEPAAITTVTVIPEKRHELSDDAALTEAALAAEATQKAEQRRAFLSPSQPESSASTSSSVPEAPARSGALSYGLNTPAGIIQWLLSTIGVLGFIFLIAYILKKSRFVQRTVGTMRVESQLSLGPKERIVKVRVDGQRLLLGVTSAQITFLRELESEEDIKAQAALEKNLQAQKDLAREAQKNHALALAQKQAREEAQAAAAHAERRRAEAHALQDSLLEQQELEERRRLQEAQAAAFAVIDQKPGDRVEPTLASRPVAEGSLEEAFMQDRHQNDADDSSLWPEQSPAYQAQDVSPTSVADPAAATDFAHMLAEETALAEQQAQQVEDAHAAAMLNGDMSPVHFSSDELKAMATPERVPVAQKAERFDRHYSRKAKAQYLSQNSRVTAMPSDDVLVKRSSRLKRELREEAAYRSAHAEELAELSQLVDIQHQYAQEKSSPVKGERDDYHRA